MSEKDPVQIQPRSPDDTAVSKFVDATIASMKRPRWFRIVREVIAIFVWFYIVVHVFVTDVDRLVLGWIAPGHMSLLAFKPLVVVILLCSALWLGRRWKALWSVIYVIIYPLNVILLRVPYLVLRQQSWDLAIAFMNGVGAFFVSLRHTVTMATWFLVSAAVVLFAHNKPLLWTAMLILLALLVITYVRRAATALKKSRLFIVQEKIVALLPKIRRKMFALEDKLKDKPYEQLTPEEANTWKQRLTISLILNRLCLFAARKLRAYGESAWAKLAPAFTAVMLFAATTVTFALTNLAAFKLIPDSFVLTASPGLILFVHYSFNRMVFNTIPEVVPKHSVAILLYDLEAMFSVLLGLVFISLILTMRRERQTAEMNRTIESFGEQGRIIEQGIVSEYHFRNIDDAISALEKVQQGVTAVLYNIAERI